ncbi:hypothetical protein ACHQM5_024340 [Ranunculus cassubicifolius]
MSLIPHFRDGGVAFRAARSLFVVVVFFLEGGASRVFGFFCLLHQTSEYLFFGKWKEVRLGAGCVEIWPGLLRFAPKAGRLTFSAPVFLIGRIGLSFAAAVLWSDFAVASRRC